MTQTTGSNIVANIINMRNKVDELIEALKPLDPIAHEKARRIITKLLEETKLELSQAERQTYTEVL